MPTVGLSLVEGALNRPRVVVAAMVGVMALALLGAAVPTVFPGAVPFLSPLRIDTDPENMLAEDEPARILHRETKKTFALHDTVVLGIVEDKSEAGAFNPQTLRHLKALSDRAKELAFTGRIVDAKEAADIGLVTRVVEAPLEAAHKTAATIASKSPHAIRSAKQLFEQAPGLNVDDAFALETKLQVKLLGSPNQLEAVQARMQKRPANFSNPE